jgi:hypothetical protein
VVDHLAQHFDRRPLRADDLVTDDPRDHLVVTDAPHRDALVPFDECLRELVQLLVLAALHVDLDHVETGLRDGGFESLAQRRRDATDLAESRRVEAAPMAQHPPDGLVLPRRHLLEHVELRGDELQAKRRTAQQPQRGGVFAGLQVDGRAGNLGRPELEPELRGLVDGLEEELVRMCSLIGRLLQREQLVRAQVALVIRRALAGQNRLGEVLVGLGRQGRREHTSLQ